MVSRDVNKGQECVASTAVQSNNAFHIIIAISWLYLDSLIFTIWINYSANSYGGKFGKLGESNAICLACQTPVKF